MPELSPAVPASPSKPTSPVARLGAFLGFGAEDGFRVPNGVLASALPQQRCFTQPGGHTWSVWTPLFERMLAAAVADAR